MRRARADGGGVKRKARSGARTQGTLYSDPDNCFDVVDEEGVPCLPPMVDATAPSNGVRPGSFGTTDSSTGLSLDSSLAARLNWHT